MCNLTRSEVKQKQAQAIRIKVIAFPMNVIFQLRHCTELEMRQSKLIFTVCIIIIRLNHYCP